MGPFVANHTVPKHTITILIKLSTVKTDIVDTRLPTREAKVVIVVIVQQHTCLFGARRALINAVCNANAVEPLDSSLFTVATKPAEVARCESVTGGECVLHTNRTRCSRFPEDSPSNFLQSFIYEGLKITQERAKVLDIAFRMHIHPVFKFVFHELKCK